jgi:hypothetical protein
MYFIIHLQSMVAVNYITSNNSNNAPFLRHRYVISTYDKKTAHNT